MNRERKDKILKLLEKEYANATTELIYSNTFELLIATILSAQCTDRQVNKVTPRLFDKYPKPQDYISITAEELEKIIKSCGFYKTKARNIINTCRILVSKY